MVKILWLSRHTPQPAQVAALEERFGDVEIIQRSVTLDNNPRIGADEVERMLAEIDADEMMSVLPIAHVAELTRRGIQPIRAAMIRMPTGNTLPNGEIEYRFDFARFEREVKVEILSEPL